MQTSSSSRVRPIKIAILAMGGEGGGVLADWIVDLGEFNGYVAQTTSVPGVAQRTGATIYYVELFPKAQAEADGGQPVLALMPLNGDVDVVLASELMEAGRAIQRGLVTPDRTTLISSTHRVYAIGEKAALGDGRADSDELLAHARASAKRFISFDMAEAADRAGSVISAVLFGALSASGVLPFSRAQFEATIERGGVGVKSSVKAFGMAYAPPEPAAPVAAQTVFNPKDPRVAALLRRVQDTYADPASRTIVIEGVRRLIDYQDPAYAEEYLDRLDKVRVLPQDSAGELTAETARHLALWMSYEDTIRVADLKTRAQRFDRVKAEVKLAQDQQLDINEFMHPRLEEICETLPAGIGRWLLKPGLAHSLVARFTTQGRIIRTSSLAGFLMLYGISRMRRWRRSTLRFQQESARIDAWLASVAQAAVRNPQLAVEIAKCQRLVKGYSDTHARGVRNFETLMGAVASSGDRLAPATLRELRDAALADEHGRQLQAALTRHALG